MKVWATLVLVGILGICTAYGLTNGEDCNASTVCDKAAGLICSKETNKCSCTSGVLTESINYTLGWVEESKRCLSVLNSGCIGTIGYKVDDLPKDVKPVECAKGLFCAQVPTLPPLVGVCKEGDGNGSQMLGTTTITFYLALLLVFVFRR